MIESFRYRKTFAEINLRNLKSNISTLLRLTSKDAFFCPMIKADGYGHGELEVADCLVNCGVSNVGVSLIEEALRIKGHLKDKIQVLSFAFFDQSGAQEIVANKVIPVLSSWNQISLLERNLESGQKYPVHIKFNIGMSRLGFELEDIEKIKQQILTDDKFNLVGVCSHLPNSEDTGEVNSITGENLKKFEIIKNKFTGIPLKFHLLNSAALLRGSQKINSSSLGSNFEVGTRPGLAIYGVYPEIPKISGVSLEPVMQLKSSVGQIRSVKKGDSVSYGGRWKATKDTLIGVVPIGYADGYSRFFSNKGKMLFRGKEVAVIGSVCMDYTMVDLGEFINGPAIAENEEIVIFGTQMNQKIGVDDLARSIGTISYEILTCLGKRIPRTYIHD